MMAIDDQDINRLREIFVTRKECDDITDGLKQQFHDSDKRLAVIEQQLKTITWILTAVGAGVISMIVKLWFGGL